jgi:hypothetical protein
MTDGAILSDADAIDSACSPERGGAEEYSIVHGENFSFDF